ncbi:hypothetical protein GCM10022215_33130 [Nocardioides fonticola]|uniref:Phosphoesterase n=1 Tax=Nocardioides fonticola TaxID=450363 RepID=A0ABP7XSV5_9ACTN
MRGTDASVRPHASRPQTAGRRRRWQILALLGVVLLTAAAGCAGQRPDAAGELTASVTAPQATASSPDAPDTPDTTVGKVLVVMVENHSLGQMRAGMPWLARLAERYAYAADYHGVVHPSLPNYLAIAGGSTFGVRNDASPAAHRLSGASVFGRAVAAGGTARLYADAMPQACALEPSYPYAVKHNPWAYFVDERDLCAADDVPVAQLADDVAAGDLPTVGMLIPDLCHDAHDCRLGTADAWLKRQLRPVLAGPDFTSGDLALVITADEDDDHHGNRVLTVVAHPSLERSDRVVRARLNHYGLSRSLAEVAGVRPLRQARTARSVLAAFGLTPKG